MTKKLYRPIVGNLTDLTPAQLGRLYTAVYNQWLQDNDPLTLELLEMIKAECERATEEAEIKGDFCECRHDWKEHGESGCLHEVVLTRYCPCEKSHD